ncbi:Heat shock transcription factor A1c1 [Heracleum sosnowskyi]|uniref:Heat stress transcription factor n=1 Tax=Heracleum sosnowskyi TaxID=360622 RepID=A0AAD8HXT6_9APIA|nr:Heat shock transcription factor A1c1 [Heracleum sosnowskyi]
MASTDGTNNPAGGGSQSPLMPTPISNVNAPPPFLVKTYEMVENPAIDKIVSWSDTNNSFIVWDPPEFGRDVLPKYFKHNNFSSFVRQLNTYGFRKVDPDRWEFANEGFLRGQRHLLRTIVRRKPTQGQSQQPQQPHGQSSSVGACVEVGTFGLEEEVERLKRDKNVLMQELVRLRQQQQTTDNQLQTMVKRLHGMEQRQQQMMSFLAKAVNSPGFLSHFVQQQNESTKRLTEGNKKRRIKPDDGQIVKYQPNVIEAAKALLTQIAKSDASPRLETFDCSSEVIPSNMSSPLTSSDHGSSPTHSSGGTLSKYPPISANSYVPSDSGFILSGPSASISDIKAGVTSDALLTAELPDVSSLIGEQELPSLSLPLNDINDLDISKFEEMISGSNVSNPSGSNGAFLDPASLDADQTMSLDIGGLSPDLGIDWDNNSYFDEMQVLDSVDPAWEQFLEQSLVHADGEAMDSTQKIEVKTLDNEWSKAQMQRLTEQMDHLSSDTKKA